MTNVTLTTEQAQQIEEALVRVNDIDGVRDWTDELNTIRAARAQEQAEQEPVEKEIAAAVLDHCYGSSAVNNDMIERTSVVVKKILDKHAAPQPVSQEYQDHLVNQSFDWAAMATKHQFMEGYRIGLAEMREKCAKVCEEVGPKEGSLKLVSEGFATAIRSIDFEGDTGFRPVSEMIAEHKQDPKKAAAIEKAKMRKAEQEPLMDYERINALREGEQNGAEDAYFFVRPENDTPSLRKMFCQGFERGFHKGLKYAAPVRTKDLTDEEIMKINVDTASIVPTCDRQFHFARAVIAAHKEKNNVK